MKHFTLLAFLCLLSWQGNAQILNQAASWPNAAWTLSGTYSAPDLLANPTTVDANFSYDDDGSGSGSTDILEVASPVIDLTPASVGGETWVNVDYDYDYNLGNVFNLEWYDADLLSWVVWEALPDNSGLTSGWCAAIAAPIVTSNTLDISGFTANQLAGFRYRLNYDASSTWGWGMCVSSPTVYSTMPPACLDPSALTATGITSTGANLGWTDNAAAGLFNVEYGMSGFALGTGTQIMGATNNPEPVTGLTPSTGYDFYVQVDCGGGNLSAWIGPLSFNTAFNAPSGVSCGAGFATTIFSDDMETAIGWTGNIGTAAGQWDYPTAFPGGNSTSTGPSGPASGVTYAEYEASGSQALASMVTPMIDLSSGSSEAELSFYMHAYGSEIGTLNVGVGTSPGGPFTSEFSWTGQYQTSAGQAWEHIGVDISAYLGQQIYIEFAYAAAGPNFYGDLAIDLVEVETCVTCPAPSPFNLVIADTNSAEFAWTENGAATQWEFEYGAPGFTPGTGSTQLTVQNPDSIVGLTPNTFYEVYLQSVCGLGDTSAMVGPIVFNTYNQGQYMDWNSDCGPGFIDISTTGTPTDLTDDAELDLILPFPILFQGVLMTDVTIAENGAIILGAPGTQVAWSNNTIANAPGFGVYGFWDDIDPGAGPGNTYYETIGTPGNQQFIVQVEKKEQYYSGNNTEVITFEFIFDEATNEIYVIYDDVVFGGSSASYDNGASATVGLSGPNQDIQVSYNNAFYLENNSCITYYYTNCPAPQNYTVTYTTANEGAITWTSGLSGETNWTVIYGVAGFDPGVSGTVVTTSTPALIMPGLDDITTYDVYIYADCSPVLQSIGATGSFTTLPNCANPSGIVTSTAVDTVMTQWLWTENVGYPSTGFDIEYGWTGFTPGSGTYSQLDNNYSDTTADMTLMGGGVYQIYVQAICGTDSSAWIGPVPFTMPLTNDSTCFAEDLMVDGTLYTFNNAGASIDALEGTIAPPATGCQTQDGWCNSNLNLSSWYTFTAPASGNVRVDCAGLNFDSQVAAYEVTDCNDFSTYTLVGANDDAPGGSNPSLMNLCGLTPGAQYYLMHDSWSTVTTGSYNVTLTEVVVEAGTDNGLTDICLGDTIDLYTNITGNDAGGVWSEDIPTANFNDPFFVTDGLASQEFGFAYVVNDGCATDTVTTTVEIYGPSSAGIDGTIDACMNQPLNLMSGLSGNVDFGGNWYDPVNNPTIAAIVSSSIPGQFNFDYVTGNGVCPDDTANVIVDVNPGCDYLNLQELHFNAMDIHPNPTTGMVYISNNGSDEVYNIELTDLNGKVISTQNGAINGTETTELSLTTLETGIYLIRVFNDNAEKTFRIVKQ